MLPGLLTASEFAEFIDMRNLDRVATVKSGDMLILQTEDGAKTLKMDTDAYYNILDEFITFADRRTTFRGKNLGSTITNEQYDRIGDGSFKDMFIGDYWLMNGIHWRIADMDYYRLNNVDSIGDFPHQILIFPDETFGAYKMFDTADTSKGYLGSIFCEATERNPLNIIYEEHLRSLFGEHLFLYREYLSNKVTNDLISGGVWSKIFVSIPTEPMIFGTRSFTAMKSENTNWALLHTLGHEELSLLTVNPLYRNPTKKSYWLRDIYSQSRVAFCAGHGYPDCGLGNNNGVDVRIVFSLCKENIEIAEP